MPETSSSQLSITKLRRNRVFKLVIYVICFTAIVWLLYARYKAKFSSQRTTWSTLPTKIAIKVSQGALLSSQNTNFKDSGIQEPVLVKSVGNYEPPEEPQRDGPGEGGKPHRLLPEQDYEARLSQARFGMNLVCSDEIPLNRSVPDLREEECKHWNYPENLPKTSVIIVFHNEGFSPVMRTVHSVINRTPPQLLEEVLLVDDYSFNTDLKAKLDSYVRIWNGTVRVIRNKQREGLINTRSRGAREAHGEVIVFLDAHCEVGTNWLPPLLAPIYKDKTTMTVPLIDGIESTTFEIKSVHEDHHFRGIFEWGMLYKEADLPAREIHSRAHQSEPYKSPTHAGGLFAINRQYFLKLGAYDPGLEVWGGENFELSFKIWQCEGRILWVPCSRVAHVYKSHVPFSAGRLKRQAKGPVTTINYKRVIETWMDDKYKEYFYTREPIARYLDMGDIREQLKLKEKLHCKNFQWYMENVAYDVTEQFPELPPNVHWGQLKSLANQLCLDTIGRDAPTTMSVSSCSYGFSSNQLVRLNSRGQLGIGERCVDVDSIKVTLEFCKLGRVSGPWMYHNKTNVMYHRLKNKCLAVNIPNNQLSLVHCDPVSANQQWEFKEVRP